MKRTIIKIIDKLKIVLTSNLKKSLESKVVFLEILGFPVKLVIVTFILVLFYL